MDIKQIKPGEMLKVLVLDEHDVEDEQWAKVISNEKGEYLFVSYFCETSKVYKGAPVFAFESKVNRVDLDSISEHHEDVTDVADLGFVRIAGNSYASEEDIDDSDSDSDIYDDDDDDDDDDFVAEDGSEPMELPSDHKEVDDRWDAWVPRSDGERRFKNTIDAIEKYARVEMDNQKLCAKRA